MNMGNTPEFTHLDESGNAHMVDVTAKSASARRAVARCTVNMKPETAAAISSKDIPKGDVIAAARIAGIMAAKRTSDLIPLCHPLPITKVALELVTDPALPGVRITATVKTTGQTGVEMEALTAVSVAALTVYDMTKAVQKDMEIGGIRLVLKEGGKSGRYEAK